METDQNTNIQFIPIGGVGKIGSNLMLVRVSDEYFIIDSGILFPDTQNFGVNFYAPDFEYLKQFNIKNVIITHGHEDHIGAVSILLRYFPDITIHASRFSRLLIQRHNKKEIKEFDNETIISISNVEILPIHVNHSIPETFGLLIKCKETNSCHFYVSDFKTKTDDYLERPIDFEKLKKESSDYSLKTLFCDSTNILKKDYSQSELSIYDNLEAIINDSKNNIFITFFPSNIHRAQTIFNIARNNKLPIFLIGRSMENYLDIAKKNNYLNTYKLLKETKSIKDYNDRKKIFLLSGSQGDFFGALRRLSDHEVSEIKIQHHDSLLFSSKTIPGNENNINKILNKFSKIGCSIFNEYNSRIHVSGHPGREDIQRLIDNYKPDTIFPIHGEHYFLKSFIDYFPTQNIKKIKNGDVLTIKKDKMFDLKSDNPTPAPIPYSQRMKKIEKKTLKTRYKIAQNGVISLAISNNEFSIQAIGINSLNPNYIDELTRRLKKVSSNKNIDEIELWLKKEIKKTLHIKPEIVIHYFS